MLLLSNSPALLPSRLASNWDLDLAVSPIKGAVRTLASMVPGGGVANHLWCRALSPSSLALSAAPTSAAAVVGRRPTFATPATTATAGPDPPSSLLDSSAAAAAAPELSSTPPHPPGLTAGLVAGR